MVGEEGMETMTQVTIPGANGRLAYQRGFDLIKAITSSAGSGFDIR